MFTLENTFRLSVFLGLLVLLGIAEQLWPRQYRPVRRSIRWTSNLGLGLVSTVSLRLLQPLAAVSAAAWAAERHLGLLPWLHAGTILQWLLTLLLLDLTIYWQHRLMHRYEALWRLHRVHHSDLALDVTSALRFHPLEIILSMSVKMAAVVALGAPLNAVLAFAIVLNATAMFNHSNLALPLRIDRLLRWLLVTPDMHRIHHRPAADEHDRNFGFNLSCWDWIFSSYREHPAAPQKTMQLGLDDFREDPAQGLGALLMQPLKTPQRG